MTPWTTTFSTWFRTVRFRCPGVDGSGASAGTACCSCTFALRPPPSVAWLARTLSPLDYRAAVLDWQAAQNPQTVALGPGAVSFRSPLVDVDFASGNALAPERRKPLDTFLTERYCLYAATPAGVVRLNVHHLPWPLVEPRVRLLRNEALRSLATKNPLQPDLVHLSPGVEVAGWPSVPVSA